MIGALINRNHERTNENKTMDVETFGKLYEQYMGTKRDEMKRKYNRVLPSGELIFNRYEKAKYLNYDEGTSIYDASVVMGDVKIGKNTWIGPYTLLEGLNAQLTIGDNVAISAGVLIYTHDSTKCQLSGGKETFKVGDVSIGSNTMIGSLSTIACGVNIGNHCVIGAHSFVNKDIPDYKVAVGVPAQIIGDVIFNEDGTVRLEYYKDEERESADVDSTIIL